MPFFSIIIPTYNSAQTIEACLSKVLSQTFSDFEIIIMDGVSSDETLDIIGSFKDKRIRIFSEKDKGVYDAMNKAIKLTIGEWLYFLGSDDLLYDDNVFFNLKKEIDKQFCDIIYGNAFLLKEQRVYDGPFTREILFTKQNICHQAIFYKKNVFERLGGFNLQFILYADWDFNIRCFSTPDLQIYYTDLMIVYYNDLVGFSKSGIPDPDFFRLTSAIALQDKIKYLENYIKELKTPFYIKWYKYIFRIGRKIYQKLT